MTCSVQMVEALVERARRGEPASALSSPMAEHLRTCASCRAACERAARLSSTWRATAPTRTEIARARLRLADRAPAFDRGIVHWAAAGAALALALLVVTGRSEKGSNDALPAAELPREVRPARSFFAADGNASYVSTAGGATHPVYSTMGTIHDIAIDGGILYIVDSVGGAIVAAPVYTKPQAKTIATGQAGPWRLAVDATHVYWTNFFGGQVMRAAR